MQLNFLGIAFFLLLLPGLVCAVIVSRLTTHRDRNPTDFVVPSLIYGFIVFVAYQWIASGLAGFGVDLPKFNLIPQSEKGYGLDISPAAITLAVLLGIVFSFGFAASINHKLLHRIARWVRVTNKFGDRDVWSFMMTSNSTDGWILIRDRQQNLFYAGKVIAYSDEEDQREVVLSDTHVFDNITGDERYYAGIVYFSFARDSAYFEIPTGGGNESRP